MIWNQKNHGWVETWEVVSIQEVKTCPSCVHWLVCNWCQHKGHKAALRVSVLSSKWVRWNLPLLATSPKKSLRRCPWDGMVNVFFWLMCTETDAVQLQQSTSNRLILAMGCLTGTIKGWWMWPQVPNIRKIIYLVKLVEATFKRSNVKHHLVCVQHFPFIFLVLVIIYNSFTDLILAFLMLFCNALLQS